ncbi:MAG: hypothetical protein ACOVP7_09545 [Lacibacter sp.]
MRLIEDLKSNYFKKGTRTVEPIKVVVSLIVVVFLVIFYFYNESDLKDKEADRRNNTRYTVGFSTKRYKNPKSSKPTIEFYFFYRQSKYRSREHIDAEYEQLSLEEKRYYVEFSSINPCNCRLLFASPVPDSVNNIPDDGWSYMPGYEKK